MATKPTVYYFQLRGRGEPIKLGLAAANVEFDSLPVEYATMKEDLVAYPFGQCPRYTDDSVDLCQSNAILRHIGRKYNLYGGESLSDQAHVDAILEGVEALRLKYGTLVYQAQLENEAKTAYISEHVDPSTKHGRNGGAHLAHLAALLGAKEWMVGSGVTIADVAVFDIVDLHMRILGEEMKKWYGETLVAHHARVAALPGVAAYLASPLRLEKVNGNGLGGVVFSNHGVAWQRDKAVVLITE